MPRKSKKSKSSKKKKTSKPPNISSSEDANLSEANKEKQFSDEGATASFQTKKYDFKSSDDSESRNVYFDDENYEFNKTHSSPKDSKDRSPVAFEKSELDKISELSKRVAANLAEIRSKLSESSISETRPKLSESSILETRSKLSESSIAEIRSKLSELSTSEIRSKLSESPTRSESFQSHTRSELIAPPVTPELVESSRSESIKSISESVKSRSDSVRTSVLLRSDSRSLNLDSVSSLRSLSSTSIVSPKTRSAGPRVKLKSKSRLQKSLRDLRKISSEPYLKPSLSDWEVNYSDSDMSFRSELSDWPTRSESVQSPKRSESVQSYRRSELVKSARSVLVEPPRSESVGSSGSESIESSLISVASLRSVRTELAESPRTKSADPYVKSKSEKSPLRRIFSEPNLKSKLTDWAVELLFTAFTKRRYPNFLHLFDTALNMFNFMEHLGTLRKADDNRARIVNNRWKQNDSSDWFELLNLWDNITPQEIKAFMYLLECMYDDFNEGANISVTIPDYYAFIEGLKDILKGIDLLLKRSTNCIYKYSRFCATSNESIFLKNVSDYRRKITCFKKEIKTELDKFIVLEDLARRGQS